MERKPFFDCREKKGSSQERGGVAGKQKETLSSEREKEKETGLISL